MHLNQGTPSGISALRWLDVRRERRLRRNRWRRSGNRTVDGQSRLSYLRIQEGTQLLGFVGADAQFAFARQFQFHAVEAGEVPEPPAAGVVNAPAVQKRRASGAYVQDFSLCHLVE